MTPSPLTPEPAGAAAGTVPEAATGIAEGPAFPQLSDFPDSLSPMLVKELRQGLKTWIFSGVFITLQIVLALSLLLAAAGGSAGSGKFMTQLSWIILVVALPLRAFGALSEEIRSRTLDALVLTKLSAFRISSGKWAALMAQSTLIALAILPYLIMRYFYGGVNVFAEIRMLLFMILAGGLHTAWLVCLSSQPGFILRVLLAAPGVILAWISIDGGSFLGLNISGSGSLDDGLSTSSLLYFAAASLLLTYLLLDIGATRIAPASANLATRKRLITLGALVILVVLEKSGVSGSGLKSFALALAFLAGADALTEAPATAPSTWVPFLRAGVPGRLAAWLFLPGWTTGLWFFLLAFSLAWFPQSHLHPFLFGAVVASTLLAPAALAHLLTREPARLFPYLLGTGALTVALGILIENVKSSAGSFMPAILSAFTPVSAAGCQESDLVVQVPAAILAGVWFLLLLILAFRASRATSAARREAQALVK